jgi:2,4-dienoyl-CoA reductase (NADPH2)
VDLFEAEPEIGGQLRYAREVPGKADYGETIRYFKHELDALGVDVHLGAAADMEMLWGYAHVIVATGVLPRDVDIPGRDLAHVITYQQAFEDLAAVGQRVAVVGAGGIAVDLAEWLAHPDVAGLDDAADRHRFAREHGLTPEGPPHRDGLPARSAREITIMRRAGKIGAGVGPSTRWAVVAALRDAGVRTLTGIEYRRITAEGLWIVPPAQDGAPRADEQLIRADTIVIAAGQEPDNPLARALACAGIARTVIGGALDTAGLNAVRAFDQGLRAATRIATELATS